MLTIEWGHRYGRALPVCRHASVTNEDDESWLTDMAWAVPQFSKQQVNKAGDILVREFPDFSDLAAEDRAGAEDAAWFEYFEALDVINNWRSSHNFPLNTFQNGLRKKGKQVDAHCLIAQRIKRLSSIELKLRRFGTMTLSQMQDIGGCRAIVSSVERVRALCKLYAESEMKHKLHHTDDYLTCFCKNGSIEPGSISSSFWGRRSTILRSLRSGKS
jgi:hypothetical protein